VTRVVVSARAVDDLTRLIRSHSLPPGTRDRVRASIRPLAQFPLLGPALSGRWEPLRFILGPWRWMLVLYRYDDGADEVLIASILDARSSRAPRSGT